MKKTLLFLLLITSFTKIAAQWTSQFSGFANPSRGLSQIKIVDANTVWALAFDNANTTNTIQEFTRTTNGGTTWTAGTIEMGNPDLKIINICPVSATTAWVAAIVPNQGRGVVYKTTNGGISWEQQLTNGFQAPASFLNGVYFFNENIGVAYGNPISGNRFEIYRTTNGGTTWTSLPSTSSAAILNSNELGYNQDPIVAGGSLWFTTSKGRLYRSSDMGATFQAFQAPTADFGGGDTVGTTADAIFSDANNGYILKTVRSGTAPNYTYTRTYAITTNGGQIWSPNTPLSFSGTRYHLTYVPGTTRIIATSADPLNQGTSVSTDNGSSWTSVESSAPRGIAAFLNLSTGWCGGVNGAAADGIYKLTSTLETNELKAAKFKVYPNPATSAVTISATDMEDYKLSVADISGKILMTKSLNGIENDLDIAALSNGIYFFELSSGQSRQVVKILKN